MSPARDAAPDRRRLLLDLRRQRRRRRRGRPSSSPPAATRRTGFSDAPPARRTGAPTAPSSSIRSPRPPTRSSSTRRTSSRSRSRWRRSRATSARAVSTSTTRSRTRSSGYLAQQMLGRSGAAAHGHDAARHRHHDRRQDRFLLRDHALRDRDSDAVRRRRPWLARRRARPWRVPDSKPIDVIPNFVDLETDSSPRTGAAFVLPARRCCCTCRTSGR